MAPWTDARNEALPEKLRNQPPPGLRKHLSTSPARHRIGLLALGIACLPSTEGPRRNSVIGLCAFNVGMTILLAWAALATTHRGVLLWPATVLHAVIAAALLAQLTRGSFVPKPKETRINSYLKTVFSQQKNIPYDADQKNDPKQENHSSHLEIRITPDTPFRAQPLQYPGVLNDHGK